MNRTEKITYLQNNHFREWIKTRDEMEDALSNQQEMFCICGRLATGLHERNCKKFRDRTDSMTLAKLKHLLCKGGDN